MALARPVGFFVVLRFQGRFFSPLLEMMDAESELSRLTVRVEVFPFVVVSPGLMLGNSALRAVGDSTMAVAEKASGGAVADRVVMGAGALSDLFEDCLRICPEEGASVLLGMVDAGLAAASRRLVNDEDGVTARCMLTGLAVVGVTTSSMEMGEGEAVVVAADTTGVDVEVVRGLGPELSAVPDLDLG